MALMNCPECKGQVSSEAGTCPNCGHPIRPRRQRVGLRILLSIVLIGIGSYLMSASPLMPGAVLYGLFMVVFGGIVLVAVLWSAATS